MNIKDGWMKTESRNLEFTGVLSAVERQIYEAQHPVPAQGTQALGVRDGKTEVTTTVTLRSRLGERFLRGRSASREDNASSPSSSSSSSPSKFGSEEEQQQQQQSKPGFFRSWGTSSLQRSIELIGLRRAEGSQPKAKEGMKVVLERLRQGGLVAVLEGMRRDKESAFGSTVSPEGGLKSVWSAADSRSRYED